MSTRCRGCGRKIKLAQVGLDDVTKNPIKRWVVKHSWLTGGMSTLCVLGRRHAPELKAVR